MEFKKYNSIENTFRAEYLQRIFNNGFYNSEYVVQEKVHGSNFSFITDGKEVLTAKRTGFIEEDEKFNNSETVKKNYLDKVKALFHHLSKSKDVRSLTIFGELFGGGYPHKDVEVSENAKLVQKGVYYSPDNDFFAFDILINNEEYLGVDEVAQLFEDFGFIYAKSLFKGSLDDCLAYQNDFKTTLPAMFNLPEIEGNICEGVIIKPIQPLFLANGSRVILKNKNEKWSENNGRIDRKLVLKKSSLDLSEGARKLCDESCRFISENRLSNVLSKIGEVKSMKEYGKVLGMFNKDIITDFVKEFKTEYEALEKTESKAVNKFINTQAGQIVTVYFKNHIKS